MHLKYVLSTEKSENKYFYINSGKFSFVSPLAIRSRFEKVFRWNI